MYNVVILYAPDEKDLKEISQEIQKCLDKKIFKAKIITAAKAQIPDIAAADLVILGSKGNEKQAVHNDFSELLRAFTGINLAGRVACFFVTKQSKTYDTFLKVLVDSNIIIHEQPLYISDGKDKIKKNISTWIKSIIKTFKGMVDARKV